jgi:siroheme synthase-like protein
VAVFPLFIELENKICLMIGGGKVALRKAEVLYASGADIHVFSKTFEPEFLKRQSLGRVECHVVCHDDLTMAVEGIEAIGHVTMLICATDSEEVNHRMALWAKQRRIPVNSATNPEDCDFYFPSIIRRGNLITGVSTGGRSPALTRRVARQIQELLPEWYETLAETGQTARTKVRQAIEDRNDRKEMLSRMLEAALADEGRLNEADMDRMLRDYRMGERDDR